MVQNSDHGVFSKGVTVPNLYLRGEKQVAIVVRVKKLKNRTEVRETWQEKFKDRIRDGENLN